MKKTFKIKRLIASITTIALIVTAFSIGGIYTAAADSGIEYAWFPMNELYITQTNTKYDSGLASGLSSTSGHRKYAFDLAGSDTTVEAPFTGKVLYKDNGNEHAVFFQSTAKVKLANGKTDYLTCVFVHDDDISDITVGTVYHQGDKIYDQGKFAGGKKGGVSGRHLHLEIGIGKLNITTSKKYSENLNLVRDNGVQVNDALYVKSNTTRTKDYYIPKGKTNHVALKWGVAHKLTVYYNANGGKIGSTEYKLNSSGDCLKADGTKYVQNWYCDQTKTTGLTNGVSTFNLTKSGYKFAGWSLSKSGGVVYGDQDATVRASMLNSNITSKDCSVTLYAVWESTSTTTTTYTVSYNANGGSGAPSAQIKTKGANLTLSSVVPTRSGYDFKGWATSAGGAVAYNAGGTYKTDASVTLYAVWAARPVMPSVTLKAESDITKNSAVVNFEIKNPSKLLITASGVQIRKKGNTDWQNPFNEDISAKTEFNKNASIPGKFTIGSGKEVNFALSEGTTYEYRCYCVYNGTKYYSDIKTFTASGTTAAQTYTVSYNANGGSGAPSAQTKTKGVNLTLSSKVPTRSGYDFKGWATSAGGAVAYNAGGTYKTDASVTLYAVWAVHQHSYTSRVTKVQTCTEDGEEIYTCSKCNESYVKVIPATGHNDADGNGYCDSCNTYIAQCDCICHATGFMGFIYFIVRFIWRITGTNPVCNCGARHY